MHKRFIRKNSDWLIPLLIWSTGLLAIVTTMVIAEDRSVFESIYYGIVTASTVGYGDICPTTTASRIATIYYICTAIVAFGILLDVFMKRSKQLTRKEREGMSTNHKTPDLVIIGYPTEEKVKTIVNEIRLNMPDSNIVCITNQIEDKPGWMYDKEVFFVQGRASVKDVLERANVPNAKNILILSNDPTDASSDEYSSSAVMMCEVMNPGAYTIAEKVRTDSDLFKWSNCDKIVDVCRASELVQEILHKGAIDFIDQIFSAQTREVHKNIPMPMGSSAAWFDVVMRLVVDNIIAVGYSVDDGESFIYIPDKKTIIPENAIIKVIST